MKTQDTQKLLDLYRDLLRIRLAEEAIGREYFKDEMKTPVHIGIGGEAIPVGVLNALPKAKVFGTYRNHGIYLTKTHDLTGFFGELYGRSTGCGKGKAGSMHMMLPDKDLMATSAVVATTIPVAVGAAYAERYKGSNNPVTVFFGDGAVEEGVFWESLNFASLMKLPIYFICEDNSLAIHAHPTSRRGFKGFAEMANAFSCHFAAAKGDDVLNVIAATEKVSTEMKRSPGPALLHFTYTRFLEHVGINEDFDIGYRQKPESHGEHNDPIGNMERALEMSGISRERMAEIHENISNQVQKALDDARKAPFPAPEELFTDVFA
jgi:TPP-dependent pyruvate/acetoin dehydrogenase alpha subunit